MVKMINKNISMVKMIKKNGKIITSIWISVYEMVIPFLNSNKSRLVTINIMTMIVSQVGINHIKQKS